MSEQLSEHSQPRQKLVALLQVDFTPPEKEALAKQAERGNDALASFLSVARGVEDIDACMASDKNVRLGERVETIIAPAPVTDSFKRFIAHQVRWAHACQSKVDELVTPEHLGLVDGDGIFDPRLAKDIEAKVLQNYALRIVQQHMAIVQDPQTHQEQLQLYGPIGRTKDYIEELERFGEWGTDYQGTYGENPVEQIEPEALFAAASHGVFGHRNTNLEVDNASGVAQILQRLEGLRDAPQQGND